MKFLSDSHLDHAIMLATEPEPEPTEAEIAYEAHDSAVSAACTRAWEEWPLEGEVHVQHRWSFVSAALSKADAGLEKLVHLDKRDHEEMKLQLALAQDANRESHAEGFRQNVECYMAVFRRAIEWAKS